MKNILAILLIRCCFLISIGRLAHLSQAADWPQWGGTGVRNMVSHEKGLPSGFTLARKTGTPGSMDLSTARHIKWVARMGSMTYGNPTVARGRVFVGTNMQTLSGDARFKTARGGVVLCLNESTGERIWQLATPGRRHGLPPECHFTQQHLGMCSSPTVDGERVYVVTNAGDIVCLDVRGLANGNQGPYQQEAQYMAGEGHPPVELTPQDGDILWRYDLIDDLGICPHDVASCSVLIHGDMLYTSTSNGVDKPHEKVVRPQAPSLVVLDKHTGRLLATDNEGIGTRLWHAQWCSPSKGQVGDQTLVFVGGGDGICYAFAALTAAPPSPTPLKKVWSYDCNPPQFKYRDGKLIPYYEGDKRKRGSTNNNDGAYLGPSQIIATPVFYENRIYIPLGQDPAHGRGRGMLHCIDATQTGDITQSGRIWTYDKIERTMATVAIDQGLLYVIDVAGTLHCVDANTGTRVWTYETDKEAWGGPLLADDKLYFGNERNFYIMAAGRTTHVLSKTRMGQPVFSTPIVANQTVYVATRRDLWALSNQK